MPKITPIQTNFTSGELSPRLMGRVDIKGYTNGAKTILNAIPLVEGGVKRRPGSRVISEVKYSTLDTRIIPYVFSKDQAYAIEMGNGYARFYTQTGQVADSGGAPAESPLSYPSTEVFNVEYVQSSDSINFAHVSYPPFRLFRVTASQWVGSLSPFDPMPFSEIGNRPQGTMTLDAVVGTITLTSSVDAFHTYDVGRHIASGPGVAKIVGYTDAQHVTVVVTSQFASTSAAANDWTVTESPQTPIVPSSVGPAQATITLTALGAEILATKLFQEGSTLTVTTASDHGLAVDDFVILSGFESSDLDGKYQVTSVPNSTEYKVECETTVLISAAFGRMYKYGAGEAFAASDVNRYVRLTNGLVRIIGFTDATTVTATVLTVIDSTAVAAAGGWSIEDVEWNAVDGYPRAISLFQQRLIAGGTASKPQGLWGSATGSYYDFQIGTKDADAFSFVAASDQVNPIIHLVAAKVLAVFTQGGEFVVSSGSTKSAITPTSIDVDSETVFGSVSARPIRVGNEVIYVQRGGRKIRNLNYQFDSDSFASGDLTALAQHMTESGIVDCAFQTEPTPTLWFVRTDGALVSLTYDKDQQVAAWAKHTTSGSYRSVACIPGSNAGDDDVLFVVVERLINGVTRRFVEIFDSSINTDCAIVGSSGAGDTVWTGLSALEGQTVDVKADGTYIGKYTVSGGQITIERAAYAVEIGLHYDTTIDLLPPVINGQTGTSIGSAESTNLFILRVLDTIGGTINGQEIPWREFTTGILDQAPQSFTGDKDLSDIGWGSDEIVTITQDQPYPFHLLAVIRSFTPNQG